MPDINASRVSGKIEILNQAEHERLSKDYMGLINDLELKYPVTVDKYYEKLVNFKTNKDQPIHGWFDYKQGYADKLVRNLIDYSELEIDDYVLDPFTGVGTTQVSAQAKGVNSIGIDINPIASLAAKVKTHNYSAKDLKEIKDTLKLIKKKYRKTSEIPKYKKLDDIFSSPQLEQILSIKGFYEHINNEHVRGFFKLGYLSIIEPVSNRVKDGNGIKISRTKKQIIDVFKFYEDKCKKMLNDLLQANSDVHAVVIEGSLLNDSVYDKVKKYKIGSIIYSPPYANCFDYLEVYKMEVWLGGFVSDYDDFKKYRNIAIRSHVNSKFDKTIKSQNNKAEIVADFIGTYNIWNKNIPSMLKGYFDDMYQMIEKGYNISRKGALCAIVVANSGYKGVIVPTDLLLAEMAETIGYKVDKIIHARDIRASSQQTVELKSKSDLMRESIIILRK